MVWVTFEIRVRVKHSRNTFSIQLPTYIWFGFILSMKCNFGTTFGGDVVKLIAAMLHHCAKKYRVTREDFFAHIWSQFNFQEMCLLLLFLTTSSKAVEFDHLLTWKYLVSWNYCTLSLVNLVKQTCHCFLVRKKARCKNSQHFIACVMTAECRSKFAQQPKTFELQFNRGYLELSSDF